MATLSLKGIKKIYDGGVTAVHDFNLEIADKEFIVLVGPSGCGKSTTLRMIAGLEEISEGELYIGDKLMNDVEPKDRDIAMVFQSYALYPHMTVYDNMAFALKLRKLPKEMKNCAWVFDMIPMEVSLAATFDGNEFEVPFYTFVQAMGEKLLGKPAALGSLLLGKAQLFSPLGYPLAHLLGKRAGFFHR